MARELIEKREVSGAQGSKQYLQPARPKGCRNCRCLPVRRAVSLIAAISAGPAPEYAGGTRTSHSARATMMSMGRLTKAAPGRSDSALRNAFVNTSETDSDESTSALYLVTGLQRLTESIV